MIKLCWAMVSTLPGGREGWGGGGGCTLIWAIQKRAAGQGMVFWPCYPEQGL